MTEYSGKTGSIGILSLGAIDLLGQLTGDDLSTWEFHAGLSLDQRDWQAKIPESEPPRQPKPRRLLRPCD